MTLRQYIFALLAETAVSAVLTIYIVFALDPYQIGVFGLSLFYVSLFLSCLGLFSLLDFGVRYLGTADKKMAFRLVRRASVHALVLSVSVISVGLFLALRFISPLVAIIILAGVLLLEIRSVIQAREAVELR